MCEGTGCPLLAGVRDVVAQEVRAALAAQARPDAAGGPLLVTVPQAAAMLGVSRSETYTLLARGLIQSMTVGRARRVLAASLSAFVEAGVGAATVDETAARPVPRIR